MPGAISVDSRLMADPGSRVPRCGGTKATSAAKWRPFRGPSWHEPAQTCLNSSQFRPELGGDEGVEDWAEPIAIAEDR